MLEFKPFPKIARLNRECIVTEKIDGTNACVVIAEDGKEIGAQSRNQMLTEGDSFGFALWVEKNKDRLLTLLGPGHHYGEWWGAGIQRRYGLAHKCLSLFNVERWKDLPPSEDLRTVPVLYRGLFDTSKIEACVGMLRISGSIAAPGFMKPEGVVIYHVAAGMGFKVTLEKDESPKGAV